VVDRFQDMPPKMRRFVRVGSYSATPVIVVGLILGTFIDFRLILLAIVLVAIAVLVPLGIAAKREQTELSDQPRDQQEKP
jgi:uncharacterized protein YneF (UPF0154 family)